MVEIAKTNKMIEQFRTVDQNVECTEKNDHNHLLGFLRYFVTKMSCCTCVVIVVDVITDCGIEYSREALIWLI
jgi:hypothetical protein